ncbi:MAG TPA: hypothetical protein VJA21_02670 [Verrucomicrobiae bacterium]
MARNLQKGLVLAVAALILGLVISSVLWTTRTPAFPTLPNPNGYDDFVKASELVEGPVSDFPAMSAEGLSLLVATNAEAMRLCRLGLTRTCSVPTETTVTNFSQEMARLPGMKKLGQLLAAEGRLAELESRSGDAARCYAEAMRLGNETSHGGFLIHRLVGVALEAIGGMRLARLVPALSPQEARAVLAQLEKIDANAVTWDEVMRNENIFCRHELRRLPNPARAVVAWWTSRATKERAREKHDAAQARMRLMMVELGLRCYQADHGRAPAALEELVPKYLIRIPTDPFTGRALTYKPQGTNWLVYSVGPDRVDDGGGTAGRGSKTGDLLYSSSW